MRLRMRADCMRRALMSSNLALRLVIQALSV
jgi:hypothetical protein